MVDFKDPINMFDCLLLSGATISPTWILVEQEMHANFTIDSSLFRQTRELAAKSNASHNKRCLFQQAKGERSWLRRVYAQSVHHRATRTVFTCSPRFPTPFGSWKKKSFSSASQPNSSTVLSTTSAFFGNELCAVTAIQGWPCLLACLSLSFSWALTPNFRENFRHDSCPLCAQYSSAVGCYNFYSQQGQEM